MGKFIKKTIKSKKTTKKVELPKPDEVKPVVIEEPKAEVIKKGKQEFVVCPKCGWKHTPDTTRCRFCGAKIGE